MSRHTLLETKRPAADSIRPSMHKAARQVHTADPSVDQISGPGHDFGRIRVFNDAKTLEPDGAEEEGIIRDQALAPPGISGPSAPSIPLPVFPAPPIVPLAPLTVTIPPNIRGTASPPGMANRIPPRVDTPVTISVSGFTGPMLPITLSIGGANAANGTATIDGAPTKDIVGNTTVQLRGASQTIAGNAGALRVVAGQGGVNLASSAGFSVSSIPQNYNDTFSSLLTGPSRGFVVQDSWESDSGAVVDLDQAEISEEVQVTSATGCFSGVGGSTSGYLPATVFSTDTHGTPVAILTSPGVRIAQQTCKFKDKRAGSSDIPMTRSGYTLTRTVRATVGAGFEIETRKAGAATTANGIASAAGSGSIAKTQPV